MKPYYPREGCGEPRNKYNLSIVTGIGLNGTSDAGVHAREGGIQRRGLRQRGKEEDF